MAMSPEEAIATHEAQAVRDMGPPPPIDAGSASWIIAIPILIVLLQQTMPDWLVRWLGDE